MLTMKTRYWVTGAVLLALVMVFAIGYPIFKNMAEEWNWKYYDYVDVGKFQTLDDNREYMVTHVWAEWEGISLPSRWLDWQGYSDWMAQWQSTLKPDVVNIILVSQGRESCEGAKILAASCYYRGRVFTEFCDSDWEDLLDHTQYHLTKQTR